MAKIFGVFAVMNDPVRVWPVTWGDFEHCVSVRRACRDQAQALAKDLEDVWNKMALLKPPVEYRRGGRSTGWRQIKNKSYDDELTAYKIERDKLEAEEHAIHAKHRDSMLDVLFPFGTEGFIFEVEYVVWAICEDARSELTTSELTIARSKLHGLGEHSDSRPPNLDPDPKISDEI